MKEKQVYLFELDSVRNSEQEIAHGQKVLFETLIKYGYKVVLSFNQLSDSQAFLGAVKDKESYDSIMRLFETGMLKVSLYGEIRTPSQYMQDSIQKCLDDSNNIFFFSGIPVQQIDHILLEEVLKAIRYDDPERLMEYYERKEEELQDGEKEQKEELERIEYLYRYVKLILLISEARTANNPPKRGGHTMKTFIDRIQNNYVDKFRLIFDDCCREEIEKLLPQALRNIQEAEEVIAGWACESSDKESPEDILKKKEKFINDRSNYYKVFRSKRGEDALFLSEAIIDLCYNYTIEDSISHIMKHYQEGNEEDFRIDFEQRLCQYWKSFRDGNHVFHDEERTDCIEYKGEKPDWQFAVRFIENNYLETERGWLWKRKMKKLDNAAEEVENVSAITYEQDMEKQEQFWKKIARYTMIDQIGIGIVYIIAVFAVELGLSFVQNGLEAAMEAQIHVRILQIVFLLISAIVFVFLPSIIEKHGNLPDILEIKDMLKENWSDRRKYKAVKGNDLYHRVSVHNEGEKTQRGM